MGDWVGSTYLSIYLSVYLHIYVNLPRILHGGLDRVRSELLHVCVCEAALVGLGVLDQLAAPLLSTLNNDPRT